MEGATVGLYADCNSLWHGAYSFAKKKESPENPNPRVDYRRLSWRLLGDTPVLKTAYVLGGPNVSMDGFKNALTTLGYEVVTWDKNVARTARCAILADILNDMEEGVNHFVIATQDAFFAPVLSELKAMGKRVSVACFGAPPAEYANAGIDHQPLGEDVFFAVAKAS